MILGCIAIAIYWTTDNEATEPKERVFLPNHDSDIYQNLSEIKKYHEDITKSLKRGEAILPLDSSELDSSGVEVQKILLRDREFVKDSISSGGVLRSDMMTIRPAIVSVLSKENQKICKRDSCYQALKYNFVRNLTTRAVVDVDSKKVLEIRRFADMQPDISLRLKRIAQAIALHAPEIKKELKGSPKYRDMSMANVRGSLNNSPCENSKHLCVAPTFSYHDRDEALWAIVDLTDLKLVAGKWAGLGKTSTPSCISERSLQNRHIMENFCQKDTTHSEDGWEFRYRITGSDGLEVIDASFGGQPVLKSAKIVDWHVAYRGKGSVDSSGDSYVAGRLLEYVKEDSDDFLFGYNDAMGCPMFSTSVVLPFNAPRVKPILKDGKKVGFYLLQDYRNPKWPMACNYRYENRFEFYKDGSFRVVGVNKGRGCGENAIYRPVMRIDMDLGEREDFFKYSGDWDKWLVEQSDFQRDAKLYKDDRFLYKISNSKRGYYIEPNRGQFGDKSRGDNATLFVTKFKKGEGDSDLLTLGSCCKLDEDGVERYIESKEDIEGEDIVIWYVPRIKNDAREGHEYCWADTVLEDGSLKVKVWPCSVGAMFVPISKGASSE